MQKRGYLTSTWAYGAVLKWEKEWEDKGPDGKVSIKELLQVQQLDQVKVDERHKDPGMMLARGGWDTWS